MLLRPVPGAEQRYTFLVVSVIGPRVVLVARIIPLRVCSSGDCIFRSGETPFLTAIGSITDSGRDSKPSIARVTELDSTIFGMYGRGRDKVMRS
jgi:hypothetical protein